VEGATELPAGPRSRAKKLLCATTPPQQEALVGSAQRPVLAESPALELTFPQPGLCPRNGVGFPPCCLYCWFFISRLQHIYQSFWVPLSLLEKRVAAKVRDLPV
jgi:hypothetical protein